MSPKLAAVEEEALRLSMPDRAKLAYELLESLDAGLSNESVLEALQRRAQELECGEVQAIPAEDVFRKGRALLK